MKSIKKFSIFLTIILFSNFAIAKPNWVTNYGKHSDQLKSKFLIGFGLSSGVNADAEKIAKDNARADLSSTITVQIDSMISSFKEEIGDHLTRQLTNVTQSSTSLNLIGLSVEIYVDRDRNLPQTFALAHARRIELQHIYSQKSNELIAQLSELITLAESYERSDQRDLAIKTYRRTFPIFDDLAEAQTILLVATGRSSIVSAFDELENRQRISRTEVQSRIDRLALDNFSDLGDVVRAIVFQIGEIENSKILVIPFTFQNTKISSPFSAYLRSAIEARIGNAIGQTKNFTPKSAMITRDLAIESGADHILFGNYWIENGEIRIIATLRKVGSNAIIAGTEIKFPIAIVPKNLDLKPQNFAEMMAQQNAFAENEIISGALQIEVWTNKGGENLLFAEGEEVKIYVRVNRPSNVRLLNILADGSKTLLFDGFYIDQSKVNRVVQVPDEFECVAPFGAEMLIAIARTADFDPIETIEIDGYHFIDLDDPKEVAVITRGTKGFIRRRREDQEIQQSETKIVVTTIPR